MFHKVDTEGLSLAFKALVIAHHEEAIRLNNGKLRAWARGENEKEKPYYMRYGEERKVK